MIDNTQILNILPERIRKISQLNQLDFQDLQEIRIRIGQTMKLCYKGGELEINNLESPIIVSRDMKEILEYVSRYSLFAYEHELKQGYITIRGGHRVGVVGKVVIDNDRVKNMKCISSINIRIAHEIKNCGNVVLPYIVKEKRLFHTLIISPPGGGKTTLLRDLIRLASNGNEWIHGTTVGVVDERSEIGGCYQGVPQNDLGCRTDILDGCPKNEGMLMLIRSMSPEILAVDEIGGEEEIRTMRYAMHCGCKLMTTIHGTSLEEIQKKPMLESIINERLFERYIVLGKQSKIGRIERVFDERIHVLYENIR